MARNRIPGLSGESEVALSEIVARLEARLAALESRPTMPETQSRSFSAREGQFITVEAPPAGLVARLPEPTPANRGARITLNFKNANPVRLQSVGGLVNGVSSVISDRAGTFDCISDGETGWFVSQLAGLTGTTVSPADATYFLETADADLPNARVADDSTEIDLDYATPGFVSWFLKTASVVFAKVQDLTGLSVLGRAANSSGVMAAITASAARQTLSVNAAGNSLAWGFPVRLLNSDTAADLGQFHTVRFVDGIHTQASGAIPGGGFGSDTAIATFDVDVDSLGAAMDSVSVVYNSTDDRFERAALTGAVASSQNSNATLFAGIRDNGSAENDRTNLNFLNGTNTTATITDDAANDELEIRVNVDDFPLTGLADQANQTGLANKSGGAAPPTAVALGTFLDSITAAISISTSSTGAFRSVDDLFLSASTGGFALEAIATPSASVGNDDGVINVDGGLAIRAAVTAATGETNGTLSAYVNLNMLLHAATGGVNIQAGGTAPTSADSGDIAMSAVGGGVAIHAGATPVTGGGNNNVVLTADGDIAASPTGVFRVSTNGTERLEIEGDGAWQVQGDTGSAHGLLRSAGSSASPAWTAAPTRCGQQLVFNGVAWVVVDDIVREEFLGGLTATQNWTYYWAQPGGTSASISATPATGRPGVMLLRENGTGVGGAIMQNATDNPINIDDVAWMRVIIRVVDDGSGTPFTSASYGIGLADLTGTFSTDFNGATPTLGGDGIVFMKPTGVSTWRLRDVNASAGTNTTAGTATVDVWTELLAINNGGGSWAFYQDQALIGTHTGAPTNVDLGPAIWIDNDDGAAAFKNFEIDLFEVGLRFAANRAP